MSDYRSPILEYATYNPVPAYSPPDDTPFVILLTNEAGSVFADELDKVFDTTEE